MRRAARVLIFPLLIGGALAGTWALLRSGLPAELAIVAVSVGGGLCVAIIERVLPYETTWNRSHADIRTDVLHLIVSMAIVPALFDASVLAAVAAGGRALGASLGSALWPTAWPVWAQLILAALLSELGPYWTHRWTHEHPFLWRIHATHHSTPRLYFLNVARVHPLDALFSLSLQMTPLALLGCPSEVVALLLAVGSVHGSLQHSNIDMRLGPLNWVFSNAELHRWHHVRDPAVANHNYGQMLIVWDVVFGTRSLPPGRPTTDVGLFDLPGFPQGYLGQVASPFRWPAQPRRPAAEP